MYTYKDRIKAVRLYLKLGKRLGVTIRQVGYPTKNTLIGWYREYLAKQDLRVGYSRSRGRYTDAQKHKAVEHYLDQGRCMAFTLRELGYPSREVLTNWIDELHPEARPRMVGRAPNVQHPTDVKKAAVIELCTRTTSPLRQTSCRLPFHADDPRQSDTTCKRIDIRPSSLSRH